MSLKVKRSASDKEFREVWTHIEDYVPRAYAVQAVNAAAAEITQRMEKGWRVAYAWSGGKDSQALRVVCDRVGIFDAVISVAPYLEFPSFTNWLAREKWKQLEIQERRDLTLHWLADHEELIFPTQRGGYWWVTNTTHWGQQQYYQAQGLDCLLLGRRIADDNFIGRDDGMHVNAKGIRQFCPLRHWSHELTLAVIHYYGMRLPPNYDWPEGWVKGTGVWPGRDRDVSKSVGYANTWAIDSPTVLMAARTVQSARDFVEQYVNGGAVWPVPTGAALASR